MADRDDQLNNVDLDDMANIDRNDRGAEADAGETAFGAASATGAGSAGMSLGSMGAAVSGQMAADDLMDDGGNNRDVDNEADADSFAGGDSAGDDRPINITEHRG